MRIELRCLPEHWDLLPRPVPARGALPEWLRRMPATAMSELVGAEVRTLKQCPPFIDAMSTGVLLPLAVDIDVDDGALRWDGELPLIAGSRLTRSPIGVHVPEQAEGAPFRPEGQQAIVKFTNFWTIATPPGWSLLVTHPLNREDLPFRALSGIVDTDRFSDGFVHVPALWIDPDFSGRLERGTPFAQIIPVFREAIELEVAPMDEAARERSMALLDALDAEPGVYRKHFREGPA